MSTATFMEENFKHFNARETLDAAKAWVKFTDAGNKMFLAMAGAMSTAEIGISLAAMIRAGKISAISCTGANLEEDIFNLVAHDNYKMVPNYRDLTPEDEEKILKDGYNRVTDTCIPESVMYCLWEELYKHWKKAEAKGSSYFPCEYIYQMIANGFLDAHRQIPREHSWVIAAYETGIPIYTPGWEDSTFGNMFTACVIDVDDPQWHLTSHRIVRTGTEQFEHLVHWYSEESKHNEIGFFQIGGGIAGDFSICCVPSILQDLQRPCKLWGYFCQIGDSTTSYGSYSGAVPNEKITWNKLGKKCPKFMINSDASIVAPLIFQYVLERSAKTAIAQSAPAERRSRTPALARV